MENNAARLSVLNQTTGTRYDVKLTDRSWIVDIHGAGGTSSETRRRIFPRDRATSPQHAILIADPLPFRV